MKVEALHWVELSQRSLKYNIHSLATLAGPKRTLAVSVKANAYGHGLPEVVSLLTQYPEVDYLTVHSLAEAVACRENGWTKAIMVLGPILLQELDAVLTLNLEPMIFNRQTLAQLGKLGDKAGVPIRTHLKLETGTGRQGITEKELPGFSKIYKKYSSLGAPYGAAMHFANIEDTTNHEYAELQLQRFLNMLKLLQQLGITPQIRHTACSAALILFEKTRFELVRPGIAVYGHWPSKETYLSYYLKGGKNNLFKPVLSWKCRITQIKKLPADSFIGYGCTYRTTSPTRLAVLPVGYFDGYDRGLSNLAYVLINGKRAPIRGRVCMNLMMADITDIPGVKLFDEVVLIGQSGDEEITAEQVAGWAGTINYEILARISPQVPKIVIQ